MAKALQAPESFSDMRFPLKGIDLSRGYNMQTPGTTPVGINVRSFEPGTGRARGGSRCGLSRYINAKPNGTALIQELACIVGVGYTDPGGGTQTSTSGRIVNLVAVSGGQVFVTSPQATSWVSPTNSSGSATPLASSGVVRSTSLNQKLWFADGSHYVYYDPSVNTLYAWTAASGSLPTDSSSNKPRLICSWRGRIVVGGLPVDPQNWFMSRVGDPTDWNYFPTVITPDQPIAGNNSALGLIGDVVTCLIPYTDDVLIFGGDHTIWQMSGDPMAGGQIDLVSDQIGMAFNAWCKGQDGTVYFFSNRGSIYAMTPGNAAPQRISQQIDSVLRDVNTGTHTIRLIWDEINSVLHVFISKTASATADTHYCWEQDAGAWWQDEFATNNHNPLCVCSFDGNLPQDRATLIGSWDGYVRKVDLDADDDDGAAIESQVVIGPLLTKDMDALTIKDMQAILGKDSADVDWEHMAGRTAEEALDSTDGVSGSWSAGRGYNTHVRKTGHAHFVKISSSGRWTMEAIRCRIAGRNKVQRRSY